MERRKTPKLIITFPTTTAAMAMDATCSPEDGRLIPIPKEISGSCGLAWCSRPEKESLLLDIMEKNHISYEQKKVVELY